jgi:hypothetical protein
MCAVAALLGQLASGSQGRVRDLCDMRRISRVPLRA